MIELTEETADTTELTVDMQPEASKAIETHDLDDDDFLLNVEEMFE